MKICNECGANIREDATFCPNCGSNIQSTNSSNAYTIRIENGIFELKGNYYQFDGAELVNKSGVVRMPAAEFLGIGHLRLFSQRKCLIAFSLGVLMIFIKQLIITLSEQINSINGIMGTSFSLPSVLITISNILVVVSFLTVCRYFLSMKNVVEISFISGRVCVPKNSISDSDIISIRNKLAERKGI